MLNVNISRFNVDLLNPNARAGERIKVGRPGRMRRGHDKKAYEKTSGFMLDRWSIEP